MSAPQPNEHAVLPGSGPVRLVPPGRCAYEMSSSCLGTTWHLCQMPATMRCTIRHGSDSNLLVEDYCMQHYRNAKRRTRYDVVIAEEVIDR